MPEISLLAVLPAAPAAPGHAAGTTLGVAAVQPADPQADGSTHFLAQLKSALASLASAALPVINNAATTAPSQVLAGQTTPLMAQKPEDSKATADHQSEVMPELLAALGFIPVPPAFGPTMPTTPTTQPSRAADQTTPNYVPVASAAQLAAASIADGTPLPPIAASLPVNAQTPASPPSTAAIGDSDGPTVTAPSLASPSAAPAAARLTAAPLSTAAD
ncbi:MAG TPA: hypothetical protein VGQ62_08980, partial [Chloroflexota bacterium]|nr:hypothetical protein [Chloroflexota bacterium]